MARVPLLVLLCGLAPLRADPRIDRLIARLGEEAEAFERLAPQVLGTETLTQRAARPERRFRLRVGDAARSNQPEWQERVIVSEYAFSALGGALHELRQVVSVDGKKAKDADQAPQRLAALAQGSDEQRKRAVLEEFEKHGLVGAATDFGQFLLMFTPRNLPRYEFQYRGDAAMNSEALLVFAYRQVDGPNRLTVVDARREAVRNLGVAGYVLVRAANYQPVMFTLDVLETVEGVEMQQHAEIRYQASAYGAVLPLEVRHRDLRGAQVVAENTFRYSNFRRFGASSEITFEIAPDK
jgi:hypothetical protein